MKELALCILFILLLIPPSNSQVISIGITENLEGKVTSMSYHPTIDDVFTIKVEFTNTGSVAYKARGRLDIFHENDLLFTGWSTEEEFAPASMRNFLIYWYPYDLKGNFTGRLRVYYANEIMELDPIELNVLEISTPENVFKIQDFETYEDKIDISFKSNKTLNNVLIIPLKYPRGWIFEQKKIEKINENDLNRVMIPYEPSLWSPNEVVIGIVTEDGRYFTSESFMMEKEETLLKFISHFIKILRVFSILPLV